MRSAVFGHGLAFDRLASINLSELYCSQMCITPQLYAYCRKLLLNLTRVCSQVYSVANISIENQSI